ncbi:hypothetical protein GSI_05300 [Ganoderma sinense ZZ0214-1]|uniref:BTB domain-containing protein n=1 Tax=Ganoderma sinense ZZ0214-1 TaxID=1077348 RepID=A0A2G8SFX0_9APHY|nr:hypothetical protein GSI_05300 [Ganoderma sinense ZZ0214-1]
MAEKEEEAPTILTTITKHEDFYFINGTHIFQAGMKLYRLHAELLATRIGIFDVVPLSDREDGSGDDKQPRKKLQIGAGDGLSDERPIIMDMNMVTSEEFNALLDHIYHGERAIDYSLTYLVAVLKLSQQWDCPSGETFALRRLKKIERSVPAALRLRLARVYRIEDWLKPALRSVIFTPLKLLSKEDLGWLGYDTYQIIARVREQYEVLRKRLAFIPPIISEHLCPNHDVCEKAWKRIWILQVGERLQEPILICALGLGWEIRDVIEKLDVSGMPGQGCGLSAKSSAMNCPGIKADDDLVDQALELLEKTVPVDRSYFTLDYTKSK